MSIHIFCLVLLNNTLWLEQNTMLCSMFLSFYLLKKLIVTCMWFSKWDLHPNNCIPLREILQLYKHRYYKTITYFSYMGNFHRAMQKFRSGGDRENLLNAFAVTSVLSSAFCISNICIYFYIRKLPGKKIPFILPIQLMHFSFQFILSS